MEVLEQNSNLILYIASIVFVIVKLIQASDSSITNMFNFKEYALYKIVLLISIVLFVLLAPLVIIFVLVYVYIMDWNKLIKS